MLDCISNKKMFRILTLHVVVYELLSFHSFSVSSSFEFSCIQAYLSTLTNFKEKHGKSPQAEHFSHEHEIYTNPKF